MDQMIKFWNAILIVIMIVALKHQRKSHVYFKNNLNVSGKMDVKHINKMLKTNAIKLKMLH